MTPITTRLKARLDERLAWFHAWLFKWHQIGGQREVEIETFDGGCARFCGVAFWGSPRDMFWDTLTRGVRREIIDQFVWVDSQVRNYNRDSALRAIDEGAGQIISFVRSVRRAAVKKDRILRGDGINFPPENDAGYWHGTSDAEIQAQADALKLALPDATSVVMATRRQRMLTLWTENQWWLGPLALALGLAGALPLLI